LVSQAERIVYNYRPSNLIWVMPAEEFKISLST
jgi:hypothetical protein